jgi:hypothetical protein
MAKADSTGAGAPLPKNPLIDDANAECLLCDLRGYLAVCQQLCCMRMDGSSEVNHYEDVEHGTFLLLQACRDGLNSLGSMERPPRPSRLRKGGEA